MKENYIGRVYGKLTVIKVDSVGKDGKPILRCSCSCGHSGILVKYENLENSKVLSCGCEKRRIDITGQRFGRTVALEPTTKRHGGNHVVWKFKCDCGNIIEKQLNHRFAIKSCGCIAKEKQHFAVGTRLYKVWGSMNSRCRNKNRKSYDYCGAKGIVVCRQWIGTNPKGFSNFYDWAISNGYKEEILLNGRNKWTLDRVDNNKSYSPSNCRWVTEEVLFASRIRRGWSVEKSLNEPIKKTIRKNRLILKGYLSGVQCISTYKITKRMLQRIKEKNIVPYIKVKNAFYYKEKDIKDLSLFISRLDKNTYGKYDLYLNSKKS